MPGNLSNPTEHGSTTMTASAELQKHAIITARPNDGPIIEVNGRNGISIRAGTAISNKGRTYHLDETVSVVWPDLVAGRNYGIIMDDDGQMFAVSVTEENPIIEGFLAGFHYAPSGNAVANEGGDGIPAINPFSLWDIGFRPACDDPRGMFAMETRAGRIWVDIYDLCVDHYENGTSRFGAAIATGVNRPQRPDGSGKVDKLDYKTTVEIYASHGKRLLGAEEFFAAAYGVKERCSRDENPTITGSMDDGGARFVSSHGMIDATGTMWQWGTDGHPDDPRPSLFGGSWFSGGSAGSRYASLGLWPGNSTEYLSARGACGHL